MPSDSRTREIAGNLGIILASAGVCLVAVQWLYGTAGILSLMKPVTGVDWFGTEWVLAVVAYGLLLVVAGAIPIVSLATRSSSFGGWLTVQLLAGLAAVAFGAWMLLLSVFGGLERPPFEPRPWRDVAIAVMPLVAIAPSVVVGVVTNRASRWFDDDEPWLRRSLILAAALVAAGLLLAVGLRVLCFLDATR